MPKGGVKTAGKPLGGGRLGTDDFLFDPLSMSSRPSSTLKKVAPSYDYPGELPSDFERGGYGGAQGGAAGAGRVGKGRFTRRRFRDIAMRDDEDDSYYLPEYAVGAARVIALMQIVMGSVIILIGIFAYVAKATVGPLIPAMDLGCGVVLYITGGVLGMFSKCRAKRIVAAFMILSGCSFVAATVLGSIHALAAFKTQLICAYLHCGPSPEQSPRKVLDALICIVSFLEAIFALICVFLGLHGFYKSYHSQK